MRLVSVRLALATMGVLVGAGVQIGQAQPINLYPPPDAAPASTAALPPTPRPAEPDGTPRGYLLSARAAVQAGRPVQARDALGRAETRLLNGAVLRSPSDAPGRQRAVRDVAVARRALAAGDRPATLVAIDDALAIISVVAQASHRPTGGPPLARRLRDRRQQACRRQRPSWLRRPRVVVTRALLPGRWALDGADWEWIPPDTVLRPVQTGPRVPGRYVWRDQRYVWAPTHYRDQ